MGKETILLIAAIVLAITNLTAFCLMAYDKTCAKKGKWRVPEKTLFLAAGLFGGLGGTLGMYVMHHKTKHWYFALFFPLMLVVQVVILVFAYKYFLA